MTNARGGWRRLLDAVGVKALPTLAPCLRGPVLRELSLTGRSRYLSAAFAESGFADAVGPSTTVGEALRLLFELLVRA